jgi:hypothetical protein
MPSERPGKASLTCRAEIVPPAHDGTALSQPELVNDHILRFLGE